MTTTEHRPGSPPVAGTRPHRNRGNWALRDRPGVVWLSLAALLTLVHPFVPASRWLMVHLVLLGALTHSIMVWSTHFTQALLKTPTSLDGRRQQGRRIILLLIGVSLVLVGVPTALWPMTLVGAVVFAAAILWHGLALWRRLRAALPGRFRITIRYYLLAAACVPVGATFGVLLARGLDDVWHGRLLVAHTMTMVLGWIGLTVTGTLVTLWPTMLRTRMDDRAEALARQALPVLATALVVVVAGAVVGRQWVVVGGLVGYAAGLAWWGRALWQPAQQAPPRHFATWSVSAGLGWAAVALVVVTATVAQGRTWADITDAYGRPVAIIVGGFVLQLLSGALSYLVPSVLGGGPSVVRAGQAWFDRWAVLRVAVINLGLVIWLLPSPSVVRVIISTLVLAAYVAFIPLMFKAIGAAVAARKALVAAVAQAPDQRPARIGPEPGIWSSGQLVAAVAALAVAVSLGVAVDPAGAGLVATSTGSSGVTTEGAARGAAAVTPTGKTTRVRVEAHDMRYSPNRIEVPVGDRLVIELVNVDPGSPHDLSFGGAVKTRRIMPGRSATLDVGVIGGNAQGWCTIVGHRQMGMVLDVVATGTAPTAAANPAPGGPAPAAAGTSPAIRLGQTPAAGFRAVDATLPPLTKETVHRMTLTVEEVELEVAPGVRQKRYTYNGQVPAPTLHGRVGDTFEITLVNKGSMGHSIDFHAGERAPDQVMRTVPPGESLLYRFTATRSGIWMYHCSTMPMTAHIAAGMFGAVIIEPPGLPAVDRSYVLLQSEAYLDGDGQSEIREVDATKAANDQPDALAFNGIANQYDAQPLPAKVGERVRIWVLAIGPNRGTSFHVVGGQFDTVYAEGAYLLRPAPTAGPGSAGGPGGSGSSGAVSGGSQVLALAAAQGGFVEMSFPEAGRYPFVDHAMANAERGAHGIIAVTP